MPRSTMRPSRSTTMRSASFTVETRCETRKVVRVAITARSPRRISSSVSVSTEARASSRIRMRRVGGQGAGEGGALLLPAGEGDAALAHEGLVTRWGSRPRPWRAAATSAAPAHAPGARAPSGGQPEGDVLAHGVGEEEGLLRHEADGPAQHGQRAACRTSWPSTSTRARRRVEQARDRGSPACSCRSRWGPRWPPWRRRARAGRCRAAPGAPS